MDTEPSLKENFKSMVGHQFGQVYNGFQCQGQPSYLFSDDGVQFSSVSQLQSEQ